MSEQPTTDEPFFIVQTAEPEHLADLTKWLETQADIGRAEGATFFRAAHDGPPLTKAILEGWKATPRDQGEIRWSLTDAR